MLNRRKFLIGPFLVAVVLAITKATTLASHAVEDAISLLALRLFVSDLEVPAFVLLTAAISALTQSSLIGISCNIISFLVSLWYLFDTSLLLILNQHLSFQDVIRFSGQWRIVLSFLSLQSLLIVIAVAVSSKLRLAFSRGAQVSLVLGALVIFVMSRVNARTVPEYLGNYRLQITDILSFSSSSRSSSLLYSENETRQAVVNAPVLVSRQILEKRLNVILLVVESLTAADSYLVSQVNNFLPQFDQLAKQGMLFPNFFANYPDSEGAMVALFNQVVPLPFPTSTNNVYMSYLFSPGVPQAFNNAGYATEVLNTIDNTFLGQGIFQKQMGFQIVRGRDEVDRFKDAPRFTLGAVADELLYDEALSRITEYERYKKPYFISLFASSSHPPWLTPYVGAKDERSVWTYVDTKLAQFAAELGRSNFFESGILIITGDHHKMLTVSEKEFFRYRSSAQARVPLLIIGKGFESGTKNLHFFQQSDLFSLLDSASDLNRSLSNHVVLVSRFNTRESDKRQYGNFSVFEEKDKTQTEYRATLSGNQINWLNNPPAGKFSVEAKIHSQRARSQWYRNRGSQTCVPAPQGDQKLPTFAELTQGLDFSLFKGIEIMEDLHPHRQRLIGTRSTAKIDFSNILAIEGFPSNDFAISFDGFIEIDQPGYYRFRVESDDGVCFFIDQALVIDANEYIHHGFVEGERQLGKGLHRLQLRYFQSKEAAYIRLQWKNLKTEEFETIEQDRFWRIASKKIS